jgi:hypothetical protein
MSSVRKSFAAALVGALVVALGVASFSPAHTRLFNTSTTFSLNRVPGGDTASGQLSSAKPICLAGRVVTVFQNTPPDKIFDATAIGKTTTTSTGAWTLPIQGGVKKGDNYFARVSKRREVKNRRHKHTCKGAYSPKVVGT